MTSARDSIERRWDDARTPAGDDPERRLAALRATGLLGAPAEERFDRLTRLARRLLGVPLAAVSLLDADRQFFLSAQGLPDSLAGLRETPLSHSFCRTVVETGHPLAVADAREDARVRGHPAIEGFGLVAYLAMPLALPDGCVVGALCVVDRAPRRWTEEDRGALSDLAGAVMAELAAGLRLRELDAAGAALRASEARHRALIEALGVAVHTTDAAGRLTFYNEAAAALWGWRPPLGEARWCGSWRLYAPDGTPIRHGDCPMGRASRQDRPVRGGEAVAERPDGTRVPFMAYPTPLRDGSGELVGGVNVLVDITERKAAEAALAESEARLQLALEAGRLVVWELDVATGSIVRGPSYDSVFGHDTPPPGWDYRAFLHRVLPEDRDGVRRAYAAVIESRVGAYLECRIRRAGDGRTRWIEVHGQPHPGSDGRVARLLGVVRDVTERKRTEAALRENEARLRELQAELLHVSRLSAAGEMASTLAHELNQPLTATASAVKAARRMLASSPGGPAAAADVREAIDLAAEQALRAGQIIRRLRDFVARDGEGDRKLEDLAGLAEDAGALALAGTRECGVRVGFRFDAALPPVLVDRIQIQQVLVNLMRNAVEAMAREGAGDEAPARRELAVTAARVRPDTVRVAVADTGPGLAPGVAERLFDPFVSTKPGGMGLGLSICRTIVEGHGGRLWAEPNPGGGVVFRFTLPAAAPEAAPG